MNKLHKYAMGTIGVILWIIIFYLLVTKLIIPSAIYMQTWFYWYKLIYCILVFIIIFGMIKDKNSVKEILKESINAAVGLFFIFAILFIMSGGRGFYNSGVNSDTSICYDRQGAYKC